MVLQLAFVGIGGTGVARRCVLPLTLGIPDALLAVQAVEGAVGSLPHDEVYHRAHGSLECHILIRKGILAVAGTDGIGWSGKGFDVAELLNKILDVVGASVSSFTVSTLYRIVERYEAEQWNRIVTMPAPAHASKQPKFGAPILALPDSFLPVDEAALSAQLDFLDFGEDECGGQEEADLDEGLSSPTEKAEPSAPAAESPQPSLSGATSSGWDLSIFDSAPAAATPTKSGMSASNPMSAFRPTIPSPPSLSPVRERDVTDESIATSPARLPSVVTASVAVSEDLVAVYKGGALHSCSIEGRVKVTACPILCTISMLDGKGNILDVAPQLKYCKEESTSADEDGRVAAAARKFACYTVAEAEAEAVVAQKQKQAGPGSPRAVWLDALSYRCVKSLSPVPVRVHCRITAVADPPTAIIRVHVAANPNLPTPLLGLVITVSIPSFDGTSSDAAPSFLPSEAEWNASRRIARWKVPVLQAGGKLQVQAQSPLAHAPAEGQLPTAVPVQVTGHSANANFSGVSWTLSAPPQAGVEFAGSALTRLQIITKLIP
jgi:hypothetical protein